MMISSHTYKFCRRRLPVFLLAALTIPGCSGVDSENDDEFDVRGRIVSIDDQTPVDGGITIVVLIERGGPPVLYMNSLYTEPPPSDDLMRLFEEIQDLKRGDRIGANGTEENGRLILSDIQKL